MMCVRAHAHILRSTAKSQKENTSANSPDQFEINTDVKATIP